MRLETYNSFTRMRKSGIYDALVAFVDKLDYDQRFLFHRITVNADVDGEVIIAYEGDLTEGGEIVGMGNYYESADPLVEGDGTDGYIIADNLIGFGRGGGSAIMEEIIDIAESRNLAVALQTIDDADAFYRRFDFDHIHFEADNKDLNMYYYPDGKPDILLEEEAVATIRLVDHKAHISSKSVAQAVLISVAETAA